MKNLNSKSMYLPKKMAISFPKTILALYTLIITCSFCPTNAQINISTPCTSSMIQTFMPCLSYVTGSSSTGSSPTQDCCDSLKALMAKGVECGCLIVTGNVPISTIPFVNRNLAISLPRMCQSSVPVQCKASGDRLPAPGPVLLGPTSAPTTSSTAHTQSPTAVAAPSPAESSDIEPESPPNYSLGPSANPGVRPVVDPNSDTNRIKINLSLYVVLMSLVLKVLYN